ncbi:MAG: tRNA (5-methylaminomethyl-2-thiouridine)(34)-methyltransferase MnmD [Bacteroidia bacterium]
MSSFGIIKETGDGSATIYLPDLDETYHSIHGALQESKHVFVKEGLEFVLAASNQNLIRVFEVGFGTGLNAVLFSEMAENLQQNIYFESIEKFPLDSLMIQQLNEFQNKNSNFKSIHDVSWNQTHQINSNFELNKIESDLLVYNFENNNYFDLILMDAFAPDKQAEMWSVEVFAKLFKALKPGGILVTYSAKGDVKRAMRETGFVVKRIDGPPGKKHMLRAQKPNDETI